MEKNDNLKKGETSSTKNKKLKYYSEYDEPGIFSWFGCHWGPGSSYKPWIKKSPRYLDMVKKISYLCSWLHLMCDQLRCWPYWSHFSGLEENNYKLL